MLDYNTVKISRFTFSAIFWILLKRRLTISQIITVESIFNEILIFTKHCRCTQLYSGVTSINKKNILKEMFFKQRVKIVNDLNCDFNYPD